MSDIGGVVAQLRAAIDKVDRAVVSVAGAKDDGEQALVLFKEAGRGTGHELWIRTVVETGSAGEVAAQAMRLLSAAAVNLATFVDVIAPGSAPAVNRAGEASPSGEDLVNDADEMSRRLDRFMRRNVKKADDIEDGAKKAETAVTDAVNKMFKAYKSEAGAAGTTATPSQPPTPGQPEVEHPATAVILVAGAAAVGIRKLWQKAKARKRRQEGLSEDQA